MHIHARGRCRRWWELGHGALGRSALYIGLFEVATGLYLFETQFQASPPRAPLPHWVAGCPCYSCRLQGGSLSVWLGFIAGTAGGLLLLAAVGERWAIQQERLRVAALQEEVQELKTGRAGRQPYQSIYMNGRGAESPAPWVMAPDGVPKQ